MLYRYLGYARSGAEYYSHCEGAKYKDWTL